MLRHALRPAVLPLPAAAARHLWTTAAGGHHARTAPQPQHGTAWQQHRQQQHQAAVIAAATPEGSRGSGAEPASSSSSSAVSQQQSAASPPKPRQAFSFCKMCGGKVELTLPETDGMWRHQCTKCGFIDYQNPRLVVGCIVQHEGRILLCRRGIEPQRGLWTVPAGYLECGESTAAGAARETWEEAGARVQIDAPFCTYDIPGISQVYVLFRGRLAPPYSFAAQEPESLEAALFSPEEIPFDQLAFSSVSIALRSFIDDLASGAFSVHHGVIVKRPGSGPNEPGSFSLEHHFALPTTLPSR